VYKIIYNAAIEKDLERLPKKEVKRILDTIDGSLPTQAMYLPVLKGKFKGKRKLRTGNYRIIFEIVNDEVRVLRIGHRKDAYRN